ncbi:MAG: PQQ-binding-like beta-propeller repeat protein, partial [Planctomycetales bacterium]
MKILPDFVTLLFVTMVVSNATAAEWSQFRGPGGQGATSEANLPLTWSDTENLAWKTELPGYGSSSPIALGDRLYVTCYSGYGTDRRNPSSMDDLKLHVVCLSKDGKIVWDQHVQPKLPES